jgi:hypothetical protein
MFSRRNVTRCGKFWIPAQGRKDEREAWRDAHDQLANCDNRMTLCLAVKMCGDPVNGLFTGSGRNSFGGYGAG